MNSNLMNIEIMG